MIECPKCKQPTRLVKKGLITVRKDSHGRVFKEEQELRWCDSCMLHVWTKELPTKPIMVEKIVEKEKPVEKRELYVKYTYGSGGFVATSKFIRELKTGVLVEGEMIKNGELVSIEYRVPKKNIVCICEV